jgi:4-amino-4-deoxy-L-arabinose transferase-like glycosyltransferase
MKRKKIILIFGLFLIMITFFFIFQSIDLRADARQYYNIAQNLVKGNGYSISSNAPYESAIDVREPVYPFIVAMPLLFSNNIYVIVIIQILMHLLTAFLVYKIAADFMKKRHALLLFSFVLLFPTLINYTFSILTETTFTFFQVLSIYLLYFGLRRNRWYLILVSGLACSISFLTRHIIFLFPLFFTLVGAGLFFLRSRDRDYRFIKQILLFLLVFSIIVFSWHGYKDYIRHDRVLDADKNRGLFALIVRSELVNLNARDITVYGISVFSERLVNQFFPEYGDGILTTATGFFYKNASERRELYYEGRNPIEIIYEAIKNHPFKFAITSVIEIVDFNMFFQLPYLNSTERFQGNIYVSLIRAILKLMGLLILFFSIRGMIRAVKNGYLMKILPLVGIILYYNSVFIFIDAIPRYSMPLIPFYLLFFVIGIAGKDVFRGKANG